MRAAIYCRVSSDPRGRHRSVDEQERECRQWVSREGWQLTDVYVDNDRSASRYATKTRPDWQRLTADLAAGDIDVLTVWEISRATRDRRVWAALVEECIARGVRLCVGGRVHDLDDPDEAFMLDMTSAHAVRESGITRKRVLRAVRENAATGRPHGKLTYGYRRIYDPATGQLVEQVIDEDQARVIREAARRVLAGESLYAIARDFDGRGIPTPRPTLDGGGRWYPTQVLRLLRNPAYVAQRVHRGQVIGEAQWPAILDRGDFDRLQLVLTDPDRRRMADTAVKHLLSGIARCGVCGSPMRVLRPRGYPSYTCGDGFHVARKADDLERFVVDVVIGFFSRPDWREAIAAHEASAPADDVTAEIAEKRRHMDGWIEAAAKGAVSPEAFSKIEQGIRADIAALEATVTPARTLPTSVQKLTGKDVRKRWDALPLTARRQIIAELMEVRVLPTKRGTRTFDPEAVAVEWKF